VSKPFPVRLNDDEFVDEIRVTTVPRFKTSGLSGDEWRFSVEAVALRKGREVGRRSWNRLDWALQRLLPWVQDDLLCPIDDPRMTDDLCMQPGCAEPWTVEYRLAKRGCGQCGSRKEQPNDEWSDYRRRFCERHARRGDSNLDDMDDNYAPVPGGQPPAEQVVRAEDESPAAFGGVIRFDGEGKS
jgi:hypothetical protein